MQKSLIFITYNFERTKKVGTWGLVNKDGSEKGIKYNRKWEIRYSMLGLPFIYIYI